MEFEFEDLKQLDNEAKVCYLKRKIKHQFAIELLESGTETANERFVLGNLKFDLLDKDISIMQDRMTDETLDKITDVYNKARIELEKIVAEAEPKE